MGGVVRIGISGATGRMGRTLLELVRGDPRFALAAAVTGTHDTEIGRPVGGVAVPGALRFAGDWAGAGDLDVVVDFSVPAGLATTLDHCESHGIALVVGTTDLDAALEQRLQRAAARIAVLRSANFSLGVALLARLLRQAATALPDWDLEILEAHHARKEDAPSGTALALGRAAAEARGTTLDAAAVYAREGRPGARRVGSIGFAVVRGGDIVGEHTALLAGPGERLELTHRATDRGVFARGALAAAAWLTGRAAGAYTLDDVLAPGA